MVILYMAFLMSFPFQIFVFPVGGGGLEGAEIQNRWADFFLLKCYYSYKNMDQPKRSDYTISL